MIDIDDCSTECKHVEYKNFLLLLTFCQFYIFFEAKVKEDKKDEEDKDNFSDDEREYIIVKIKEKIKFSDDDENKFNIIKNDDHVYYNHYKFLNHYYNDRNKKEITFDFIRKLFSTTPTLSSPSARSLLCDESLSLTSTPTAAGAPKSFNCNETISISLSPTPTAGAPKSFNCDEKLSPDGKRLTIPKIKSKKHVKHYITKKKSVKKSKRLKKSVKKSKRLKKKRSRRKM
jgi:hypothetical protein